jgi:hypothetical protein
MRPTCSGRRGAPKITGSAISVDAPNNMAISRMRLNLSRSKPLSWRGNSPNRRSVWRQITIFVIVYLSLNMHSVD